MSRNIENLEINKMYITKKKYVKLEIDNKAKREKKLI